MNAVVQKIEKIKSIFLDTQLFYAEHPAMNELIPFLDKTDNEFRSIAYESASMSIALDELENKKELDNWISFSNGAANTHKAQVYVGLGWAIAKLNLDFLAVVEKTESKLYHRIADGCGYHDGTFRHRATVLGQQFPLYLPAIALSMYDEGVGRSLWYSNNADINKIKSKIESFPVNRQPDLWRGVGIAVAYVGGCDNDSLRTFPDHTSDKTQLANGAALATRSRMEANTMTPGTDQCSRLWYSLVIAGSNEFDERAYLNWCIEVEGRLANNFQNEIKKGFHN